MLGYPLFLKLEGRQCLVFGGGRVAVRKIRALLKRGAKVKCVSKEFCEPLKALAQALLRARRIRAKQSRRLLAALPHSKTCRRPFGLPRNDGHLFLRRSTSSRINLNGACLVIAATSDRNFNARVAQACRRKKIWVNAVDDPEFCDFYAPAILERGPLQIAISTGGASPLFARRLREELEKVIPSSIGRFLEKLGRIRRKGLLKKKQ